METAKFLHVQNKMFKVHQSRNPIWNIDWLVIFIAQIVNTVLTTEELGEESLCLNKPNQISSIRRHLKKPNVC